ncbi:hypothetical protein DRN98_08080, partial [Methanosarcinales archaeon]
LHAKHNDTINIDLQEKPKSIYAIKRKLDGAKLNQNEIDGIVKDIVEGIVICSEKVDDGSAINLGTMERIRVIDAAKEVLRYTGHEAEIKLLPNKPTGPYNRVADNSLAKRILDWQPKVKFIDGLHRTIDWYYKTKNAEEVKKIFARMLTER